MASMATHPDEFPEKRSLNNGPNQSTDQDMMLPTFHNAALTSRSHSPQHVVTVHQHTRFPPSTCEWAGCKEKKIFVQSSDFKKHMNKHERPYTCSDSDCQSASFGTKADLQRHGREQHGNEKFLCPVRICPRHGRGFARKRNLEAHLVARHGSNGRGASAAPSMNLAPSESTEEHGNDDVNNHYGMVNPAGEISTLERELQELEARKKTLVEDQMKVDADIQAVRRTVQLLSSRNL